MLKKFWSLQMYVTNTVPSLGGVLYEMVRSVVLYVTWICMYKQLCLLGLLQLLLPDCVLVLDSYQCRSLVDCHPPCGIRVRVAHDGSLFSSLTSSHSSLSWGVWCGPLLV